MGYDKPDLGFVVHYQAPGSRHRLLPAGRPRRAAAIERAEVVLLRGARGPADPGLLHRAGVPAPRARRRACSSSSTRRRRRRTTQELMAEVNLGKGRIEAMLKVLDVEGAVERDGTRWRRAPGSDWAYDAERYERITALRRREQAAMAQFGADGRCLMRALQEELDDPGAGGLRALLGLRRAALRRAARPGARARGARCTCARGRSCSRSRRWRPTPRARCARSPTACAPRRAARSRGSATAAGTRSCSAGRARGALRRRAGRRGGRGRCARWGAPVRVGRRGAVARAAASSCRTSRARLAERARAAVRAACSSASATRPPQREMANSAQQVANVRGAFAVTGAPPPGARACSSTTSASAAGRWRWSAASCAGAGAERGLPARAEPPPSTAAQIREHEDREHPPVVAVRRAAGRAS